MAIFHGHYIDGGFTMPFYKVIRLLLLIGRTQRLNVGLQVSNMIHVNILFSRCCLTSRLR